MPSTIVDVAKEAGVSIATVSRVVNQSAGVRPAVKARVEAAIAHLEYRPNHLARSLPSGQADRVIGLVIPEIQNPVFPEIAQAVEHEARKHGYQVMLCQTDDQASVEINYTKLLIDRKVSGIIYVSGFFSHIRGNHHSYALVAEAKIPFVLVNAKSGIVDAPQVVTDEVQAGYLQASYLLERGHRHLAFVGGGANYYVTKDRLHGIQKAIDKSEAGSAVSLLKALYGFQTEGVLKAIREILHSVPRPTGILCASDLIAMLFLKEARELGLIAPRDFSIIGYDGIQMSEHTCPALTTVAQPLQEMGSLAVQSILGHQESHLFTPKILSRSSVANYTKKKPLTPNLQA